MKKILFATVILFAAAVVSSCSATSSAAKSEADLITAEHVAEVLARRMFKIDVTTAYPTYGPSFTLSYPYFLSVIGDRVESFLPYFGRAYSIPYGGGEGLGFNAPISDYKMTPGRKDKQIITFDARTQEDSYRFRIEVYPAGESYISVTASQKQGMSFNGRIDLDAEFELLRLE